MERFSVRNKRVLITGSSRGLGWSLARGFLEAGAKVLINGRDPRGVQSAVEEAGGCSPGRAAGYPFDVSVEDQVKDAMARIDREQGPVEVLINNAGIHRRGPLAELSYRDWKAVIEINLNAAFLVSRYAVRHMIPRGRGKIINITSLNAEGARPTIGNYCAAKGGLKMLTRSMATEWGQYNIQANAIGPGYFVTDLTRELVEDPEFDAWVRSEVPQGRWGDPQELIGTALYLASGASDYVNGQTIYVDGGWRASL